jgi:hypothetical protein
MPATVEAKTPAATTSKIIPPIMNELLIFALHSQTVCTNSAKAAIARRTQPRKVERALDGCRSVVSERF